MSSQHETQGERKPETTSRPVKLPHPELAYKAIVARSQQVEATSTEARRSTGG